MNTENLGLRALACIALVLLVNPVLTAYGVAGMVMLAIFAVAVTAMIDDAETHTPSCELDEFLPEPAHMVADVTQTHELPVVPLTMSLAEVVDRDRSIEAEIREKQAIEQAFDRGNL